MPPLFAEPPPIESGSPTLTIIATVIVGLFSLAGGIATVWGAVRNKKQDAQALRMSDFEKRIDAERARLEEQLEEAEAENEQLKRERDAQRERIARMRIYMIEHDLDPDRVM